MTPLPAHSSGRRLNSLENSHLLFVQFLPELIPVSSRPGHAWKVRTKDEEFLESVVGFEQEFTQVIKQMLC
ncbi:MAG: hypothetical protein RLZZ117_1081 [Cyanobacteriota bacterium]